MAKQENIDVTQLVSKEIPELRQIAKTVGLKNYLKSSKEDLIERITEAVEFEEEEETEEIADEQEDSSEDTEEEEEEDEDLETEEEEDLDSETEEEDEDPEDEEESEEEQEEAKEEAPAKKTSPKTVKGDKKEPKAEKTTKPAKKAKDSSETSKSEKVRVIVRELIDAGKPFTSGVVMIQLESRHKLTIHRSFVSAVIAQVRKEKGVPAPVREKKVAEPAPKKPADKKKEKGK